MEKVGVVARSFGELDIFMDVCNFLLAEENVQKIFHLGLYKTDPDLYINKLAGRDQSQDENGFLSEVSEFLEEKLAEEDLSLRVLSAQDGKKLLKKTFVKIAGPGEEAGLEDEASRLEVAGGKLLLLTPDPTNAPYDDDTSIAITCTSFWAKPVLKKERDRIILCPGHLSDPSSSFQPTFATITIDLGKATFVFYNLKFKKILEKTAPLKDTKFTIR